MSSTSSATLRLAAVATIGVLLCCAGCGSRADDAVTGAAEEFYSAVVAGDGDAACALLTPETVSELEDKAETDCASAVLEEDLPAASVIRVDVYGRNARAVLDEDTAFLTETRDGWQLMAVGCVQRPGRPYDCRIAGG
jgi:ketosteroid isomerase-like protein